MRIGGTLAVVALAGALAGCASTPTFPAVGESGTVTPPESSVLQWITVDIEAASDQPVTVQGGSVFSPFFERLDAVEVDEVVEPDGTVSIRLPLGDAVCPASAGSSSAQLVLESDGTELIQAVMLDGGVLADVNKERCALAASMQAAEVSLGASHGRGEDAVGTSIVLTRSISPLPATLLSVTGSDVFTVTPSPGELPATLVVGRERLEVPVSISLAQCPGSASELTESDFVFSARLAVEGAEPHPAAVRAAGDLRDDLEALVDACAGA